MTFSRPTRAGAALLVAGLVAFAAPAVATDPVTFDDPKGDVRTVGKGATKKMKRSVDITSVTLSSTESTALLRLTMADLSMPSARNRVTVAFTLRGPDGRATVTGAILDGTTTAKVVTAAGKKRRAVLTWSSDSGEVVFSTRRTNVPAGDLSVRVATGYATLQGVKARDSRGGMSIALR